MNNLVEVTFVVDYSGYNNLEEAAFALEDAIALVGKRFAVFSNPADLEMHRAAVEKAKLSRPAPWPRRRWVRPDPHRWG